MYNSIKLILILAISLVFSNSNIQAQVGINTTSPKATLDIKSNNNSETPNGILIPTVSKEDLNTNKEQYKTDQEGIIVYVKDATATNLVETENINGTGFYYFDGNKWLTIAGTNLNPWNIQGTENTAKLNTQNIYQTGSVNIGSSEELSPNIQFGVKGNSSFSDQVKIGADTDLNASAQLELTDNDKGVLINRVALTSKDTKTPVVNAVDGMLVYNTSNIPETGLTPGLYYWYIEEWVKVQYKVPQASSLSLVNLKSPCTSIIQSANTTDKGTPMDMGNIKIEEDGAYAFSFRLYGPIDTKPTTSSTMVCYYIALLANDKLVDTAEMDVMPGVNVNAMTYTIVLAGNFKAGDVLTFKLSHNTSTNYPWTLNAINDNTKANRTSMVWWKLS